MSQYSQYECIDYLVILEYIKLTVTTSFLYELGDDNECYST